MGIKNYNQGDEMFGENLFQQITGTLFGTLHVLFHLILTALFLK